jgi:type IV pilus assembly protein PilV
MMEVLVTVVVTAIGLLGVRARHEVYSSESESYQRAHAAILLEDIASRIQVTI